MKPTTMKEKIAAHAKHILKTLPDLAMPDGLTDLGAIAWYAASRELIKQKLTYTGGCPAFRAPQEWEQRGNTYARGAVLVVVYDGGSLGEAFSLDGYNEKARESMVKALEEHGLWYEEGTHYYGGVYAT